MRKQERLGLNEELDRLITEELCRPVNVREGGKTEKIPAIQAIVRQLIDAALKGNQRAQFALLAQYRDVKIEKPEYDFSSISDDDMIVLELITAKLHVT